MALLEKKTIQVGETAENEGIFFDIDPDNEYVQVRIGTSKCGIKKSELWGLAFAIADAKTQDDLMPVRKTEVMTYERVHKVRLKKSLNAGDIMKVRCHIDVPVAINESLKGIVEDKKYFKV